jgi:pyrroline-5-carboxylate reductase
MAEGWLRSFDSGWQVFSAGTEPAARVHPLAVKVMAEVGIDLNAARPKRVDQFLHDRFDYVITVCDHARETCPVFLGPVRHRLHMGFDDPAGVVGTEEKKLPEYRRVRDQIKNKFYIFFKQMQKENAMNNKSWGFIGAGRVTRILLEGFKRANRLSEQIVVTDINAEALAKLQQQYPFIKTDAEAVKQDYVFLALHPPAMAAACESIKGGLTSESVLISLAPKFTIDKMSALTGFGRLVRWLPAATTYIGQGHNPCVFSAALSGQEQKELTALFSSLGDCVAVAEEKIEAYAMIMAMGPTYFWFQWQQLYELGKTFGLSDLELQTGIPAMLHGAVNTLFHSGLSAEQVMDLIPVKPLAEDEAYIKNAYQSRLGALYQKLKG